MSDKASETAGNLLSLGVLTVEQVAPATGLDVEEVRQLTRKMLNF